MFFVFHRFERWFLAWFTAGRTNENERNKRTKFARSSIWGGNSDVRSRFANPAGPFCTLRLVKGDWDWTALNARAGRTNPSIFHLPSAQVSHLAACRHRRSLPLHPAPLTLSPPWAYSQGRLSRPVPRVPNPQHCMKLCTLKKQLPSILSQASIA